MYIFLDNFDGNCLETKFTVLFFDLSTLKALVLIFYLEFSHVIVKWKSKFVKNLNTLFVFIYSFFFIRYT